MPVSVNILENPYLLTSMVPVPLEQNTVSNLEFGLPRCVCNNEVKYNEGQKTTKFISLVIAVMLIKHVSAYCEAIIRFTMLATGDY